MSLEIEIGPKFGLSTACFMDSNLGEARKYFGAFISHRQYLPEIPSSLQVAKKLGLGLELVYRKGADKETLVLFEGRKVPVLQIHGPIWYDLPTAFREGWQEASKSGAIIDPLLSFLALGTLKGDFKKCLSLANKLRSPQIVIHPGGAEILYRNGLSQLTASYGLNLAIEPDHRRPNEASCWIWQPEKAVELAGKANEGICMDTSHTIISQRSVRHLCETYDKYKKTPKGVLSIHLVAAIPEDNPWELHRKRNGGLPLDPRIVPPYILGAFREFYQHLLRDRFSGPIIVELFQFKGLNREEAIYNTLNSLETNPKFPSSISLPGEPTVRK